jgi:mannonate dehydratase
MNRRDFVRAAATATLAAAGTISAPAGQVAAASATRRKANLKLGTQHGDTDDILKAMAAFGVNHICVDPPKTGGRNDWSVQALTNLRHHVQSFGIHVEAVRLLHPSTIEKSEIPNIMMGKSPQREREADALCEKIRNTAQADIPMLTYDLSILGEVRTKPTPGRGGAMFSTFKYDEFPDRDKLTAAGAVTAEQMWERIAWFVDRVIPVAEQCRVRMALHPQDPAMPEPQGFRGIHRVLATVDGLRRFVGLSRSPFHGLNFCQGTLCESMKNPREEILHAIRWFGSRGKIFNVHFRNIKGGFLDFQESFPDDGDVDFLRAIRAYQEVGYDGMLMPDHVPVIDGDTNKRQAYAYCFGYIQALIQMVNEEG